MGDFLQRLISGADWLLTGLVSAMLASILHKDDIPDKLSWGVFVVTGGMCSLYFTGPIAQFFKMTDPSWIACIGFLLGAFGGSLLAAVTRALKSADVWGLIVDLIKSKFGGGSQ
jgi:hypothetical protein